MPLANARDFHIEHRVGQFHQARLVGPNERAADSPHRIDLRQRRAWIQLGASDRTQAMAIAVNLKPAYPLVLGGYTFPGYIAVYTVILNLVVAAVLTPVFNALSARGVPADQTAAADYFA